MKVAVLLLKCAQGLPEVTDAIFRGHQSPIFNQNFLMSKIVTNIGLWSLAVRELKFCCLTATDPKEIKKNPAKCHFFVCLKKGKLSCFFHLD